ncbi:flavin reductase family protein [Leucobacter soli]
MSDLPAAVSLLTTIDASGQPRGATVSAVSSLSLDPPLVLVCLDNGSDTLAALPEGHEFLVHIAADGQQDAAYALARKGESKFENFDWTPAISGLPLIAGTTLAMHCTVEALLPGGDHTIVVGRIEHIAHDETGTPIVYHRRQMLPTAAA